MSMIATEPSTLTDRLIHRYRHPSTQLPAEVVDTVCVFAFRKLWEHLSDMRDPADRFLVAIRSTSKPIPPTKRAVRAAITLYRRIKKAVPEQIEERLHEVEVALRSVHESEMMPQQ